MRQRPPSGGSPRPTGPRRQEAAPSPGLLAYRVREEVELLDDLHRRLHVSRRKAKALLDRHAVFVNDRRVWMAHHRLKPGDRVNVHAAPAKPARKPAPTSVPVLFEDADYLIVDKPPGLSSDGPGGLEKRLRESRDEPDLRAAHRLDKDTSGCLLFARNETARAAAIRLFDQRKVTKLYHAIAWGRIGDGLKAVRSRIDGKEAVTHLQVLSRGPEATHVRARIETGRTHQIRKHLRSVRHPIVGDRLYGLADIPTWARGVPRHMLHAHKMAFGHPVTGAMVRVEAPLPGDFRKTLTLAGLT